MPNVFHSVTIRRSRWSAVLLATALGLTAIPAATLASASASAPTCSLDPNARLASVPSPQQTLGFPLGVGQTQLVTNAQISTYLQAVEQASSRVVTGLMATTTTGSPLPYAVVSSEKNMKERNLRDMPKRIASLRDPRKLDEVNAARIAANDPAIVWLAANVHGGEKSGADGTLKTLYELASGLSCDVQKRLDNLMIVIVPTQNPDGRTANTRQNSYGFDMNRDWFARTQAETDGKIDLMRQYPPQVFVDAHEMSGSQYFFPPNADPIHHEIANENVDWINRIGAANGAGFGYNGACRPGVTSECYFNYSTYDLFFMGYGDTVPAAGFGAAGMTYEKGSSSTVANRVQQQFNTQWATTGWAADNKSEILTSYYKIWKDAIAQGRDGALQPNQVVQPTNSVQFQVPDIKIRSYFLSPTRQLGDVHALVDRLRGMDVEVYELKAPVTIPNARIFGGRSAQNYTVPAGGYWIPLEQPQKHWIQALIGEDPYVPFPYFYDVSSWSNPLLMGIETVYTGDKLTPNVELLKGRLGGIVQTTTATGTYTYPLDSAAAADFTFELLRMGVAVYRDGATNLANFQRDAVVRDDLHKLAKDYKVDLVGMKKAVTGTRLQLPDVGLFNGTGITTGSGSFGEARFVLHERWGITPTLVSTADINNNTANFTGRSTLIVPDGSSSNGGLTAAGLANLRAWVSAGGTYIGIRNEGNRVARTAGLTSTTEKAKPSGYQVIGSHFRVDVDRSSSVAAGRPAEDFQFNNSDVILNPSTTGVNVLKYPADNRFWYNGYTVKADALQGSVALVDEPLGAGHAVLFSYNPLFRAYNESGLHLVANALLNRTTPAAPAPPMGPMQLRAPLDPVAAARAAAAAAPEVSSLGGEWRPISIEVAQADLAQVRAIVGEYTDAAQVEWSGTSAYVVIPNLQGLQADAHPYLREMIRKLDDAGVRLRSIVA